MNQNTMIEIPVMAETAQSLIDPGKRAAIGLLVDTMVRPGSKPRSLATILEETAQVARERGLTDEAIEAELAAWRTERRQR